MEAPKSWKYAYAIVSIKTGKIVLVQGELPIYWGRKVAVDRCNELKKCEVKRISIDKINKLIKP